MIASSSSKAIFEQILKHHSFANDTNVDQLSKHTCFICIHDTITNEEPYFKKDHPNVLNLWFDDVEFEISDLKGQKAVPMSPEQAQQILAFLNSNKNNGVKECMIHCTAGVSRSVAVRHFIDMYFSSANRVVLNLLLNEYRKELRNDILIPNGEGVKK